MQLSKISQLHRTSPTGCRCLCNRFYRVPHAPRHHPKTGGGERDRTDDLLVANQALSQLSYTPISRCPPVSTHIRPAPRPPEDVVGLGRFELPTSRLSGVRSNQLSYRPPWSLSTLSHGMSKNGGPLSLRGPNPFGPTPTGGLIPQNQIANPSL